MIDGRRNGDVPCRKERHIFGKDSDDRRAAEADREEMLPRSGEKDDEDSEVVERKDAEHAAHVEITHPVRGPQAVPKNARNEEPGQNKKEGDADPAALVEDADEVDDAVARLRTASIVVEEDHQHRDTAQAVKRRYMACVARRGIQCLPACPCRGPVAPRGRPARVCNIGQDPVRG